MTDVRDLFERCPARRALLFLDCCHSGGIAARAAPGSGPSDTEGRVQAFERAIRIEGGEGKLIYAACGETQSAYEDSGLGHGYFTSAVLEGIRGGAANGEGEVTAGALYEYAARRVESRQGSALQRPVQSGRMSGVIVLRHDVHRGSGPIPQAATDGTQRPAEVTSERLEVDTSGAFVMLDASFFADARVQSNESGMVVTIPSTGAELDAELSDLASLHPGRSHSLAYAHGHEAGRVQVLDVSRASESGHQVWTIKLAREQANQGQNPLFENGLQIDGRSYSAEDFMHIRGSRILLGEDPLSQAHKPGLGRPSMPIEGFLSDGEGLSRQVPLRDLVALRAVDDRRYLECARLRCIYLLNELNVANRILELRFGLINGSSVSVKFRGRGSRGFLVSKPTEVKIEGVCELSG